LFFFIRGVRFRDVVRGSEQMIRFPTMVNALTSRVGCLSCQGILPTLKPHFRFILSDDLESLSIESLSDLKDYLITFEILGIFL